MNARWFRNHLVSLIGGVVFVALLSVCLWVLHEAHNEQKNLLKELDAQKLELDKLNKAQIFPSKKNIELLRRDRDNVRQLYEAMRGGATHLPIQGPELNHAVDSAQLIRTTVQRLNLLAAEHHIRTPDPFAFGFSWYMENVPNCKSDAQDCTRLLALLSKQLLTVEKLAVLLITNKVEEIVAIHRPEVEPGVVSADALNLLNHTETNSLYHTYPFELRFICDTPVLREILNGLMHADGLFIIRALKIDAKIVPVKSLDMPPASGEPDATKAGEAARTEVRRRCLNVVVQLDLVEFAPPTKPQVGRE